MTSSGSRWHRLAATVAVAALGVAGLTGCVSDAPATPVADGIEPPNTLFVDRPVGKYLRTAVRFRSQACGGVSTGSGFPIGPHTILTNRHVVLAANVINVETWDGRPLKVTKTLISADHDLAEVTVAETLTDIAKLDPDDPRSHAPVSAVGYPLGQAVHVAPGKVLEIQDDALDQYGEPSVIFTDAKIRHGNSGGPLYGPDGTVVGIVFAGLFTTGYGIAIPVSIVHQALDNHDFRKNYTCDTVPFDLQE